VRVHVAFVPDEAAAAPTGIVVDVLRATSTIAQALASGYRRVLCVSELEEARALRAELPDSLVGGERMAVRIDGFDVGASPREFLGEPREKTVIFSTTNGTRAILETAARSEEVLLGSLLNLDAVAAAARERGEDVTSTTPIAQVESSSFSAASRRTRPKLRRRSRAPGRIRTRLSSPERTARRAWRRTSPSALR
jgi:phosphosulfolactate phosphohydrolase-like enzyme